MQTALLGRVMVKDIWCHMMSFISQKDTHKLTPVLEWSASKWKEKPPEKAII